MNEQAEADNVNEALKILSQVSRLISTKYQQNEQVKEANISYGFSRNVSSGLFLSIPASVAGVIVGYILKEDSLALWSLISAIVFVVIAFFHR